MSLLQIANVRCVPSIHGRAAFAALAERQVQGWRPDAVALEVAAELSAEFLAGVRALPRIQAVCVEAADAAEADGPVPILGMLVLDPADSIVAAARRALGEGIPVECIDRYVEEQPASGTPQLADEHLLEVLGLEAYYQLFLDREAGGPGPDPASRLRERTMAGALRALSCRHERVLCVMGMSHWARVRAALQAAGPPRPVPAPSLASRRVYRADVRADALPLLLRQWPALVSCYERLRRRGAWRSASAAVAELLAAAPRAAGLAVAPAQLERLTWLARRLAESRRRLSPSLRDLVGAAGGMAGPDCARHLLREAMSYPQPAPEGGLPVAVPAEELAGPPVRLRGRILVPWPPSSSGEDGLGVDLALADADRGRRRSFQLFLTRRAENEREDRAADAAVRCAAGVPEVRAREFRAGLRGGLDARRTTLDALGSRRIFVRDRRRAGSIDPSLFGAVLFDFSSGPRKDLVSFSKDCLHAGPKYWKLGFTGDHRDEREGWFFGAYAWLAVMLETARSTGSVHRLWLAELEGPVRTLEVLAGAVFRHAPRGRPLVAFVSSSPPGQELQASARRAGRSLRWVDSRRLAERLASMRGFHRLVIRGDHPDGE